MAFTTFPINTENASNNPFPKLILVEQGSTPATPAAGQQKVYPKTADGHVYALDDAGVERDLEAVQQTLTADPVSPANNTWWLVDDGGSPASVALRFRKGGATYTLAEVTV